MKAKTRVIHGGGGLEGGIYGEVSTPIFQVSTYKQESPGRHRGYEYSRTANPTRRSLEDLIADLESGAIGCAFASGLSAITTVLLMFDAGSRILCADDVYGGTYRLLTKVMTRLGMNVEFVDTTDAESLIKALADGAQALIVETPSNPLMKVTDLAKVAQIAHSAGCLLIVDNTFLTPYFQKPIELGADIVVHSATKYLGGHSDVVAGLVVTKTEKMGKELRFLQNATGGILGPQDSWLIARGIRTLGVRMEQHSANALQIARWLTKHPKVTKVNYIGLDSHAGHSTAQMQTSGHGGMLSFETIDEATALKVVEQTRMFTLAESLGGVESLISLPSKMTHASIPFERREALGVTDRLVRLSVGIEDVDDLIADLDRALSNCHLESD